jgi:hypothetical protein
MTFRILTASLATLVLAAITWAGEACCDHCGCQTACRKVCRLKCETKKVPKTTYSAECEDICIPGRSEPCPCGQTLSGVNPKDRKAHWLPRCGELFSRTKLVKTTKEVEEVQYKWVVETVCPQCAAIPAKEKEPEKAPSKDKPKNSDSVAGNDIPFAE